MARPFLEEALSRDIINYSALAKDLNQPISDLLRKPVKDGAIMMALRRYTPPTSKKNELKLKQIFKDLGDITVRSNLTDFTFYNSKLTNMLLESVKTTTKVFKQALKFNF